MKKATKKAGKVQTCWMWQRKDGTLATFTAATTQGDCRALWAGDQEAGKPVRVEIREAAKGKVKRGK